MNGTIIFQLSFQNRKSHQRKTCLDVRINGIICGFDIIFLVRIESNIPVNTTNGSEYILLNVDAILRVALLISMKHML